MTLPYQYVELMEQCNDLNALSALMASAMDEYKDETIRRDISKVYVRKWRELRSNPEHTND